MARLPDGCHVVIGIVMILMGIGMIRSDNNVGFGIVLIVFATLYSTCLIISIVKGNRQFSY